MIIPEAFARGIWDEFLGPVTVSEGFSGACAIFHQNSMKKKIEDQFGKNKDLKIETF